jgi:CHAT domain-containing protein/tetratricopeptide (TPR) repeat protein
MSSDPRETPASQLRDSLASEARSLPADSERRIEVLRELMDAAEDAPRRSAMAFELARSIRAVRGDEAGAAEANELLEVAARGLPQTTDFNLWAAIRYELARHLFRSTTGDRQAVLTRASELAAEAVEAMQEKGDRSVQFAAMLFLLGDIRWDRRVDPESCYREALAVLTPQSAPDLHARIVRTLSGFLAVRVDEPEALREAIGLLESVLPYWSDADPEQARALAKRAAEWRARYQRAALDEAIRKQESAMQTISREADPRAWASQAHNLGELRRQRGTAEDIESAIAKFESALEFFSAKEFPVDRALALNSLGACYLARVAGDRAQNIEDSIRSLRDALELRPRDRYPDYWAKTQVNLSGAYASRVLGDRAGNLEEAMRLMREVLREPTPAWVSQVRPRLLQQAAAGANQLIEALESAKTQDADQLIAINAIAREYFAELDEGVQAAICDFRIGDAWRNRRDIAEEQRLTQAIASFRRALQGLADRAVADLRTVLLIAMSDALSTLGLKNRDKRLGEAIAGYEAALALMPEDDARVVRVRTELGIALSEWSGGDRAKNLEKAIAQHHRVLEGLTPEGEGSRWAFAHHHLGNAYQSRRLGDRAENIEEAIAHFELASNALSRDEHPMDWAMVQNSLGITWQSRVRGDPADNQETAIGHLEKALEVYTREAAPDDWAMTVHNLGTAFMRRIEGDPDENIERAIHAFEGSLEFRTRAALPYFWAMTQVNLGNAFSHRRFGDAAENARAAARHYRNALEVFTRDHHPDDWAWAHFSLGQLGATSGQTPDERIGHLESALEIYRRDSNPERWALIHHGLGSIKTGQAAIDHFNLALEELAPDESPEGCRIVRTSLADHLMEAGDWAGALALFEQVIATGRIQLSRAYSEAGRLEESSSTDRVHVDAALCLARLGELERSLLMLDAGRSRHLAEQLARENVDLGQLPVSLRQRIVKARRELRSLEATVRLRHEDLPPSRVDVSELRLMFPSAPQISEGGMSMIGLTVEQARIALGSHGISVVPQKSAHEAARAELEAALAEARALDPTFARTAITMAEVLDLIPSDGALVAFIISSEGSLAFVIPRTASRIDASHVIELDQGTFTRHVDLLNGNAQITGWLRAYSHSKDEESLDDWSGAIERTTQDLWSLLFERVQDRLLSLGLGQAPILLMPSAALAPLPLQAASRRVDGKRRAFLDDHAVTIAPSLYAASVTRRRGQASAQDAPRLLAVVDPTGDLPYAELEGRLAASQFGAGSTRILPGELATVAAVVEAMPGNTHVHFAAHGHYNWRDVMRSYLALADDSRLTTGRVVSTDVNLEGVRLIVLSACETGLNDLRRAPDEFLGMPGAFIQGGARSVICALWAINDLSTALLFGEFYRRHLGLGEAADVALRGAQLWLRDGTASEMKLAQHWEERAHAVDPPDREAFAMARYYRAHPDVVPYAAPYYWAGFTFNG